MANEVRLIDANVMRQDWLENGQNEYVYDTNAILDSIDEQPTIDPESLRPKGRWVEKEYGMLYACDQCGYLTDYQLSKFCPFCGAKMEG